jgi:hypothetical protein
MTLYGLVVLLVVSLLVSALQVAAMGEGARDLRLAPPFRSQGPASAVWGI